MTRRSQPCKNLGEEHSRQREQQVQSSQWEHRFGVASLVEEQGAPLLLEEK